MPMTVRQALRHCDLEWALGWDTQCVETIWVMESSVDIFSVLCCMTPLLFTFNTVPFFYENPAQQLHKLTIYYLEMFETSYKISLWFTTMVFVLVFDDICNKPTTKIAILLLSNGRSWIYSINLLTSQYSFGNSLEVWSSFGDTRRWSLSIIVFFSLHILQ